MKALLKQILKVVLEEINQEHETDFQISQIKFDFTMDTMTNETENIANDKVKAEIKQLEINTILNVAANVGDEQTLKAICEVMEWDFEELKNAIKKIQEEQAMIEAKTALEQVVPEDEPPIDDKVLE